MNETNVDNKPHEHALVDSLMFAVLAFLITWGTGMLIVVSNHANLVHGAYQVRHPIDLPTPIAITLVMIGAFGPFLAAIAVTSWRSGRTGLHYLFAQFRRWRVHPAWFITAFLGPAFLGLVALCITALLGRPTPAHWFMRPRPLLFAGWTIGPWGEELGWRGYAQPALQKRLGALGASLAVGAMWSVWHYWPIATPAGGSV